MDNEHLVFRLNLLAIVISTITILIWLFLFYNIDSNIDSNKSTNKEINKELNKDSLLYVYVRQLTKEINDVPFEIIKDTIYKKGMFVVNEVLYQNKSTFELAINIDSLLRYNLIIACKPYERKNVYLYPLYGELWWVNNDVFGCGEGFEKIIIYEERQQIK